MQSLLVSTGVVALAEIGDKTQLLSLLLAARFRRPLPIIAGIFVATLVNHGLAGLVGEWVASALGVHMLRWVVGVSFLVMAVWTLIPDKLEGTDGTHHRLGVFGATLVAFFVAEMGDKTQIATVALAARYADLCSVVIGTTVGMLIANVPAVLLGEKAAHKLPMRPVRAIAALIFAVLGMLTLANPGASAEADAAVFKIAPSNSSPRAPREIPVQ